MVHNARSLALLGLALVMACDAPEVEALPSGERPSPEAQAGLPEIEGAWAWSGLSLPLDVRPELDLGEMVPLDGIVIETQRLDSLAGVVHADGAERPFVGEVRRDGVVSLVVTGAEIADFVAGRIRGDTLWISVSSMQFVAALPAASELALMRDPPDERFLRLRDGRTQRLDPLPEPEVVEEGEDEEDRPPEVGEAVEGDAPPPEAADDPVPPTTPPPTIGEDTDD